MKTVLIVQGRLGSSRLPQKALLPFGSQTLLHHVLQNLKGIKADDYFLATDFNSFSTFEPIAKQCDFKIFAGPEADVLERFCMLIKECDADVVIRATADNPFLFCDAANFSVKRFIELKDSSTKVDYFTISGMPHGSGVEVFDAKRLLQAASETAAPYDHEHVGPAFYAHKENYSCVFEPAPKNWNFPDFRITVDTYADYKKALRMLNFLQKTTGIQNCFSSEQIIALQNEPSIENPILFIPSVQKGHGTGHLRRCLQLSSQLESYIFVRNSKNSLENTNQLIEEYKIPQDKIIYSIEELEKFSKDCTELPFSLVVLDSFVSSQQTLALAKKLGSVLALDEGNCSRFATDQIDYLLDIIPSKKLNRSFNYKNSDFISLPKNKKAALQKDFPKNALVCIGGEDPASFTKIVEKSLQNLNIKTDVVTPQNQIANLKEELYKYDLVVTHYGFTAFEAAAAGCAVLTVATTKLHKYLSKTEGFICATKKDFNNLLTIKNLIAQTLSACEQSCALQETKVPEATDTMQDSVNLPSLRGSEATEAIYKHNGLASFITKISLSKKTPCPVCGKTKAGNIVFRNAERTICECVFCHTKFLALETHQTSQYQENYFFDDYKKQYGKTYLEDFESIKLQGKRRLQNIKKLANSQNQTLLDVGCAYGPFVSAAKEAGFLPVGTDISVSATEYVSKELKIPTFSGDFTKTNFEQKFNIITMWYVIEHFENLKTVLNKVNDLLEPKGIFAFSTPSANGISFKKNAKKFFSSSPADHFSIWSFKSAKKVLKMHGFKICKIVSTGHHPERFFKNGLSQIQHPIIWKLVLEISKYLKLGDTFEVYARKI